MIRLDSDTDIGMNWNNSDRLGMNSYVILSPGLWLVILLSLKQFFFSMCNFVILRQNNLKIKIIFVTLEKISEISVNFPQLYLTCKYLNFIWLCLTVVTWKFSKLQNYFCRTFFLIVTKLCDCNKSRIILQEKESSQLYCSQFLEINSLMTENIKNQFFQNKILIEKLLNLVINCLF